MLRYMLPALVLATPAFAAKGPFFSLANTDFIVTLGFLAFIALLVYLKVPGMLMGMLDKRADGIQSELDEAKSIREEAQSLLASFERKTREAQDQATEIVAAARTEAEAAAVHAKAELAASVERRIAAAGEQIDSATSAAIRDVRDSAISVASSVAAEVVASQLSADQANAMIDDAIKTVETKLH